MLGLRKSEGVRASSTTVLGAHHMASSRAAAARGTRPAVEVAAAAAAVAVVVVAGADGGPVGHRAWWPPTSVAGVRRGTRVVAKVVARAADRSTRDSTWAVHRQASMAELPAAVGGGTVCGGTANCGCGGNSRADGAGHRDRRTGSVVPADSEPALEAAAVVAGTGGWPKLAATGSMTGLAEGGTGPAADNGSRVASARTWT